MKHLSKNKFAIAGFSFILGGLTVLGSQKALSHFYTPEKTSMVFPNRSVSPFDRFQSEGSRQGSHDPFEEMHQMQNQMLQELNQTHGFRGLFENIGRSKKSFGYDLGDVRQREDDNFIYYDIDLNGQKPQNLEVQVENEQVVISGRIESKRDEENLNSYYSSSFHRSFPVPSGVDADNFMMEQEDNKIVIKFPKGVNS